MLRAFAVALIALLAAPALAAPPRLVVLVSVDQLARRRLTAELPGGLGRLLREGRVFADAALEHAGTETCPGHATLLTGVNPGRAGIPGNDLFEDATTRYCVADAVRPGETPAQAAARAGVLGAQGGRPEDLLRSPANLLVPTLGDLLPPGSAVFTVSAKDRAAIALGGHRARLAIWLHRDAGFTTSRFYAQALPAWLVRFDAERGLAPYRRERLPAAWQHPGDRPGALPDDGPGEGTAFSSRSPHPVAADTLARTLDGLLRTPYVDALTLDLARTLVEAEHVGEGPGPALLAVSLSSTDYIGHTYGPDSQEAADGLAQLDQQLAGFLRFLEARVGRERLLVVLTADHGVAPVPEVAAALGSSECRVAGGRVRGLAAAVAEAAGAVCGANPGPGELVADGATFRLSSAWWSRCTRLPRPNALAAIAARVAARPAVVHVWTAAELSPDPERCAGPCHLYWSSFAGERSGELFVQLDPTCQVSGADTRTGTGHGTPYAYDREVPIVFWGAGVAPGVVRGRARTIDIAPTLGRALGVPPPPSRWDGQPLPLR